jgi:hypothetical protein
MESKDEIISKLLKEVIYLKEQVDSLTPKLYEIKAWDYIIRNGVKEKSYFISLKHKCYSERQAQIYLDGRASNAHREIRSTSRQIFTSVEQIDFTIIEDDWINQLAKKLVI